ncbi:MAG: glycoside hydrolase family 5 protein, partial [Lachnospiraceae bacterium]|nr:glycoside hydrolase family 5 protein [Lachnospiraceae bacterium]
MGTESKFITPVECHGKLSVKEVEGFDQPVIVDKNGNPVILRGVSSHGIQWDAGNAFVNKGAYKTARDEWGVSLVRVASYVTQDGYIEGRNELMDKKIEEAVLAAVELGLYIIIDWHIHDETVYDTPGKPRFTESKKFFKKYAAKYKGLDNVIFEICNEPVGVNWYNDGKGEDIYTYCKEIVGII